MTQLTVSRRAELELSPIRLSKEALLKILEAFENELLAGLAMHKRHGLKWVPEECSLRMLDSCVSSIPSGKETGIFYALDFGGTNVRAVRCQLTGDGGINAVQKLKNLSECGGDIDLMGRNTTASMLFDVLVDCIKEIAEEHNDIENLRKKHAKLGFTFSFPCVQTALNTSILEAWTKGFETGQNTKDPVVGRDVVTLLSEAIKRKDIGIDCKAIVNDTVGTLLSCAYQKSADSPPCSVGVILGTGANCCYIEPEYQKYGYTGSIINVECGNFNKQLPSTPTDLQIDEKSPNKGQQLLEKMISGFYLGEIFRILCLRILMEEAPPKAKEEFSMDTRTVALLASSRIKSEAGSGARTPESSADLPACKAAISRVWNCELKEDYINVLRDIAFAVFDRSAALAAVSIAALAKRTRSLEGNGSMTVAVDGSLYVKNDWYGERINKHLFDLIGDKQKRITMRAADDGSGKGAAICVAAML